MILKNPTVLPLQQLPTFYHTTDLMTLALIINVAVSSSAVFISVAVVSPSPPVGVPWSACHNPQSFQAAISTFLPSRLSICLLWSAHLFSDDTWKVCRGFEKLVEYIVSLSADHCVRQLKSEYQFYRVPACPTAINFLCHYMYQFIRLRSFSCASIVFQPALLRVLRPNLLECHRFHVPILCSNLLKLSSWSSSVCTVLEY